MTWATAALGDVCNIVSGATPRTSERSFWGGSILWTTPKDLSDLDGAYLDRPPRTITEEGLKSCAASLLPRNSVLLSSRAPIGLVAINTVPMATNQGFKSLVPDRRKLDSKFLFHWLKSRTSFLQGLGNGATFKEISKAVVERIEIPLPPLDEQRQIAAILDKADALRRKRERALDLLDSLTQSIFVETFGQRRDSMLELKDVVKKGTIVTYGIVQAGPEYPGGVPYIRTGDLIDGSIKLDGLRRTDPMIAARFSRSRVEAGDIVMSIRATVGTTAVVLPELDGANLTQGTARIAPGPNVQPNYLIEYLRSEKIQRWIAAQVKGATFLEITLGRLRELPVAVPPMHLQKKFSDTVERLRDTRAVCIEQATLTNSLFSSLQSRAFAGTL